MSDYQPEPGVYVKGEQTRVAGDRASAVQAVFDGYKPAEEATDDASRAELQKQAQSLGLPAGGTKEDLKARIVEVSEDTKADAVKAPVPTAPKDKA